MAKGDEAKGSAVRNHLIHITILLAAGAAIGVYLIATTVVISRDGVAYLDFVRRFAEEPATTVRRLPLQPGYPLAVVATDKLVTAVSGRSSLQSRVASAQSLSLLCKLLATVILYFIGSSIVGPRMSFWALLILTALPLPARYGSDALTEWPYIVFLMAGLWLLMTGARSAKVWPFAAAGITAGLGYLVRPECSQLLIYGAAWLLLNLVRPKSIARPKAAAALIMLLAGFALTAGPYISFVGYLIPEHRFGRLPRFASIVGAPSNQLAAILPLTLAKGSWQLASNICENLLYYFVPGLLLGIVSRFGKGSRAGGLERFFVGAFVGVNIVMLLSLYCVQGVISKRHTLPLLALLVFYIPLGLQGLSLWLADRFGGNRARTGLSPRGWFLIMALAGIAVCVPKLLQPLHGAKKPCKQAAQWLKDNTEKDDLVSVADSRVGFYSERPWTSNLEDKDARYTVRIFDSGEPQKAPSGENWQAVHSMRLDDRHGLTIYERPARPGQ